MSSAPDRPPFFILGVPRSGTTLLAQLLDGHSDLYLSERSHLGRLFRVREKALGHLLDAGQYTYEQAWMQVDFLRAMGPLPERNEGVGLAPLVSRHLHAEAARQGKKYWGDKAPPNIDRMGEISAMFPGAKFIHIIRDPRANAASLRDRQYMHLELAARWWIELNAKGIRDGAHLGAARYHRLRYEDLLRQPEEELARICRFLEVSQEDDLPERMSRAERTNRPEAYVKKRIDPDKIDAWRAKMSAKEVRRIERQAPQFMAAQAYTLVYPDVARKPLSNWRLFWIKWLQAWRLLVTGRRKVVIGRDLKPVKISFGRRLRKFFSQGSRLLFSEDFINLWKRK